MNCNFLQASHVQVALFDDRLEITSPGGLMPGVTIERMKEGYSQIRNRALAHAFSYMNLIEGWGTGIPRLLREMKEYGLPEPEFVDMEIALRINLYRRQYSAVSAEKVPNDGAECRMMPNNDAECRIEVSELSEQERALYDYLIENGVMTSAEAEKILGVGQRRARDVLKKMAEKGAVVKDGVTNHTRYILNEDWMEKKEP